MSETKDRAGVLAPPPLIYLICMTIGYGLDYLLPLPLFPKIFQYTVGFAGIAASAALVVVVFRAFRQARTSIDPYRPTTAIITTGPFRFSRNPAYVALTMLHAGIAVSLNDVWMLLMVVPALLVVHRYVVLREEAYLERKFGDEYRDYKASVRRWL